MNNNTPFTQSISLKDMGSKTQRFIINYQPTNYCDYSVRPGIETSTGALAINTGEYTGRSPLDRFIVKDSITEDQVWWGK
jgi:phosphoenolpyruvate carboxykinase (ATP)